MSLQTWLNEGSYMDTFNLDGYKSYKKNRPVRLGGAVCLYAASELSVSICNAFFYCRWSHCFSIHRDTCKKYKSFIGVIYRSPDSDIDICKFNLEKLLYCINKTNKTCFILGDFNIDLAKDDTVTNDFINILHSFSFFSYNQYFH